MKKILLLGLISFLCFNIIGCNRIIGENSRTFISVVDNESEDKYEQEGIYGEKEVSTIKDMLNDYGDEKELEVSKALAKNLVVIKEQEFIGNEDIWNKFYNNTKNKVEDSVIIVRYTEQGDPILTYLSYKNNKYFMIEDETRDRYDENQEDYNQYEFKYLRIFEDNNYKYAYLLNDKNITLDELNYSLSSSDTSKWIPYGFIFYINKS